MDRAGSRVRSGVGGDCPLGSWGTAQEAVVAASEPSVAVVVRVAPLRR